MEENGHHVIQAKIDASKSKWAALNATGSTPEGVRMASPTLRASRRTVAPVASSTVEEGGWQPREPRLGQLLVVKRR